MYGKVSSMDIEMNHWKAFRALGDPTRLRIVEYLSCCEQEVDLENPKDGATASEVCCAVTGIESINSTISHHLHELEEAGVIRMEKKGKTVLCSVNRDHVQRLSETLAKLGVAKQCCLEGSEPRCC